MTLFNLKIWNRNHSPLSSTTKKIHELNYIYLSKLWYMYVHIRIMKQRVMFGNEGDIKCKAVN